MRFSRWFAVNSSWRVNDIALLLFRVMLAASLFVRHGWEKLSGFSQMAQHFPNPLHIGVVPSLAYATFTDGICSLLIVLGLATRAVGFFVVVNLAVVFFMVHHALSLPGGPPGMPLLFLRDHVELVVVYLAGFLMLTIAGPGNISLDRKRSVTDGTYPKPIAAR